MPGKCQTNPLWSQFCRKDVSSLWAKPPCCANRSVEFKRIATICRQGIAHPFRRRSQDERNNNFRSHVYLQWCPVLISTTGKHCCSDPAPQRTSYLRRPFLRRERRYRKSLCAASVLPSPFRDQQSKYWSDEKFRESHRALLRGGHCSIGPGRRLERLQTGTDCRGVRALAGNIRRV